MRKLRVWVLCWVLAPVVVCGQNLVPNGSFEDYAQCPSNFSQIERAVGWMPFRVTPDYYNACSPNDSAGVPLNVLGYQAAATGQGYAGIWCYFDLAPPNGREYMGIALNQPLVIGQPIYLSFKTVFASSGLPMFYLPQFNCSGIGMRFSMEPYLQGLGWPVPNNAALHLDQLIADSVGWTTVTGLYTPDSAYEYLVVGNFFDDQSIVVDQFDPGGNIDGAYFYVDDVCVTYDPLGCVFAQGIQDHLGLDMSVAPNPFVDEFTLTVGSAGEGSLEVVLVDVLGRAIEMPGPYRSGEPVPTPDDLPDGTYLLRAQRDGALLGSCRIVHRSP